jgi:hypothetical protein
MISKCIVHTFTDTDVWRQLLDDDDEEEGEEIFLKIIFYFS